MLSTNTIDSKFIPVLTSLLIGYGVTNFNFKDTLNDNIFLVEAHVNQDKLDELCNIAHGAYYDYVLVKDVVQTSIDIDIQLGDEATDNAEDVLALLDLRFLSNTKQTAIEAALDKWEYKNSFTRDENDLT